MLSVYKSLSYCWYIRDDNNNIIKLHLLIKIKINKKNKKREHKKH